MRHKEVRTIFFLFLVWRFLLLLLVPLSVHFLPLQKNFLGGGMDNYLGNPQFWAWANFDGEHYLSIAQNGYGQGEQAFFPLYPLLIKGVGKIFGGSLAALNISGLLISNLSFIFAMVGLFKLVRLDYSEKIAKLSLIFLLLFPTSFYFASVYTESLFLALVIWAFYFARKRKWFWASLLGMFASSTRFIGVILLPILASEFFHVRRAFKARPLKYPWVLLLIPVGLATYMFFLSKTSGDPFSFIKTLSGFGEQRSTIPILLPQVFYRYIFKILPNINYFYFPVVFTTFLEFLVGLAFLAISILAFFKLRLSYGLYLALGYLMPTLSGSFSSLPRYVLVLFPALILFSIYFLKIRSKIIRWSIIFLCFILPVVSTALFVRGYWLSSAKQETTALAVDECFSASPAKRDERSANSFAVKLAEKLSALSSSRRDTTGSARGAS